MNAAEYCSRLKAHPWFVAKNICRVTSLHIAARTIECTRFPPAELIARQKRTETWKVYRSNEQAAAGPVTAMIAINNLERITFVVSVVANLVDANAWTTDRGMPPKRSNSAIWLKI
jgi:hypothetical protein